MNYHYCVEMPFPHYHQKNFSGEPILVVRYNVLFFYRDMSLTLLINGNVIEPRWHCCGINQKPCYTPRLWSHCSMANSIRQCHPRAAGHGLCVDVPTGLTASRSSHSHSTLPGSSLAIAADREGHKPTGMRSSRWWSCSDHCGFYTLYSREQHQSQSRRGDNRRRWSLWPIVSSSDHRRGDVQLRTSCTACVRECAVRRQWYWFLWPLRLLPHMFRQR